MMVGHSTGGGEVARYIGRHGTKRVAAAVLIGAVPPVMVKSAANPDGIPIEVFDGLRSGVAKDRSQFWKDSPSCSMAPIGQARKSRRGCWISSGYGACRAVSRMSMTASRHFRRPTFTRDLKKFDVPTLVMHGEDDQIVPIDISGRKSAKFIKGAKELFYPGLPHGLTATNADQINADLLKFLKSVQQARRATA
jgi:non-heme chloroperoxidase